jgi:hypothetical protein
VPFCRVIGTDKLKSWQAKTRKSVFVGGIPFKPTYPEHLDLLSLGPSMHVLRTLVVDRYREDIDESAIPVRMGAVIFGGDDHDVRSRADVDDVGTSLQVVGRIIDAEGLVNGYLATLLDVSIENIFPSRFLGKQP